MAFRESGAFRALRHRNFALFLSGQLLSLTGTWMQSVAQAWLVFRLTNSSALLGFVGFATQIPVLLLGPIGGLAADRVNRHRILLATQTSALLLAFALAGLTLTHRVTVVHVFVLGALLGVVNAFDIPGRQSFFVELVGKDDLMNAIALNSAIVNASRVVGPAVAGVLVALVGEGWCFFLNGASYLFVIAGLLMMRLPAFVARERTTTPREEIAEGFTFVARTPPVRALLLLLGLVSLLGMPYAVLMPVFAEKVFHSGSKGLGILMAASGVGSLIGSLALASHQGLRGLGRWVAFAATGFGAALILFAYSPSFWLAALLLVPVGGAMMVQMAASNTLIQSMVPDALRGRVMAVYSMTFMGMAPFGALFAGALGDRLGAPLTVAIGGGACILGGLGFRRKLPALREPARRLILASQMTGGMPPEDSSSPSQVKPAEEGTSPARPGDDR